MANGTISLGTSNQIKGRIKWSSTSNGTSANSSNVTATIQVKRTDSYTTSGTWKGSLTIGDTKKSFSKYKEVTDSWVTLLSFTETIDHNADGTGACYLSGAINGPSGTSQETSKVTGNKTVALDTIERYAVLTSVPDFTDEENPTITYSAGAGALLEYISAGISADGSTELITKEISKNGNTFTFLLTEAERNKLRYATPNSNTLNATAILRSRLSGVDYESKKTVVMTVVNADPTAAPVVTDINTTTVGVTGDSSILVAGRSKAKVTVNAVTYKGASVKEIQVINGSASLSGDGTIEVVENAPFVVTVVDSRNNRVSVQTENTIVPYAPPSCFVENGVLSGEGIMSLTVTGKFYNSAIGKTANTLTVQYRVKADGEDYGNWVTMDVTLSGNEYTATKQLTGLDYQKNHTIQARAVDAVTTVPSAENTFVSVPVFDWSKTDFNFNVPVFFTGKERPEKPLCVANNRIENLSEPQNNEDAVNKAYADGKMSIVKLWENDKPSASFAGQQIVFDCDIRQFDMLLVEIGFSTTYSNRRTTNIIPTYGEDTYASITIVSPSNSKVGGRSVTDITSNGLNFQDAYYGSELNNDYCIPQAIFGIRHVGSSVSSPSGGESPADAVLYIAQTLSEKQKATARANIGAISADDVKIDPVITENEITALIGALK